MRACIPLFAAAFFCTVLSAAAQQNEPGAAEQIKVSIDTQRVAAPISKYLYGGFIEHGGTLIYRSLWSEMIDDRKFYFPITSQEAPEPASASARRRCAWYA